MNPRFYILPLCLVLLAACGHKHRPDVIARAYDQYLFVSDIQGLVPEGLAPADSAAIVSNYINQWVQQMVVLHKARKNVRNDFSKELADYKNSLLTYEYERLVVEQLLDTNVSPKEVQQYYDDHKSSFVLKNSIVRTIYVKLPKDSPVVVKLRPVFAKPNFAPNDVDLIYRISSSVAVDSRFDADGWIDFYQLRSAVPFDTYNENVFLRSTRQLLVSDPEFIYFLRILDFKFQDDISPLENEYDNIRTIILNHRKIDIIKNMQRQLLEKAAADKEIELL